MIKNKRAKQQEHKYEEETLERVSVENIIAEDKRIETKLSNRLGKYEVKHSISIK